MAFTNTDTNFTTSTGLLSGMAQKCGSSSEIRDSKLPALERCGNYRAALILVFKRSIVRVHDSVKHGIPAAFE